MNHAEMQSALGDLLEVDEYRYPLEVRTQHINAAVHAMELDLEGPWVEDTGTLAATAGQNRYDLHQDLAGADLAFSQAELLFFAGPGGITELDRLLWSEYTAGYRLRAVDAGTPGYYSVRGRYVYLAPTPSIDISVTVDFMGHAPPLAADGDSNLWTTEAPNLILWDAARRACIRLIEDRRAAEFVALVEEEKSRLLLHWSHRLSRNRVMEAEEV